MMPRTRKVRDVAPSALRDGIHRHVRLMPDTARAVDMHWIDTKEPLSLIVDKLLRKHFKLPRTEARV